MIVNTRRLALGAASQILGDGDKIIVNVHGIGPAVRLGRYVRTTVPVLAPQRVLRTAGSYDLDLGSLYAKRLRLLGSSVPNYLRICPPWSPSGAFLEAQ